MLPCLVELLLQLGHGTAVAFPVEHLFQIGGIRDDAVYEGLVLRVSFFLPLDEVGAGQEDPLQFYASATLVGHRGQLYLPFVIYQPARNGHDKIQIHFPGTLGDVPVTRDNGHLVQLQHGHLFTRNAVTFGHGDNMFHSRTVLPGDLFGNGIACRVRCRPLAGL